MNKLFLAIAMLCFSIATKAQIGYQVALLNTATGEPRANVTVSVDVALKGADGKTIFSQTQSATSNDLGLLSLSIGNANMFDNVDWNTVLPLSVSVKADGVLVAESQVLTVPVAEYAKKAGYQVTMEDFKGTWYYDDGEFEKIVLTITDTEIVRYDYYDNELSDTYTYAILELFGNHLYASLYEGSAVVIRFLPNTNKIVWDDWGFFHR